MEEESTGEKYSETDSTSLSIAGSPLGSPLSYSGFGDSCCGEPLVAQHLVLDFKPLSETVDNELAQKKCCAFWDYLSSRQDLRDMLVLPDKEDITNTEDVDFEKVVPDLVPKKEFKKEKTAVHMLEFVEDKGLIDRIFEAKMQQSHCTLGSREYHENEPTKQSKAKKKEEKITCTCSSICTSCRNVPKRDDPKRAPATAEVRALCQKLQAWDTKHPKSMSPPGHPPALSHSVMQRKLT